jgi:hypothetical protein
MTPTISPSVMVLANSISSGNIGGGSSSSNVGIAVGACITGMIFVAVVTTIRSHYKRRKAVNRWTRHGKAHSNRMPSSPITEVSHNPAVQSWRQSHNPAFTQQGAMSVRHIETTNTRKTFNPVIIST